MIDLICPACGEKLPYAKSKTNQEKSVRLWRRVCPACGAEVTDTAVFKREVLMPEHAPVPGKEHPGEGGMEPSG